MEVFHPTTADPYVSKESDDSDSYGAGYSTSWSLVATVMIPCITLALVAVIGNSLMVYAYVRSAEVRSLPFNVYILHLSVADFLVGLYNLPVESLDFFLRTLAIPWPLALVYFALNTTTTVMSLNIVMSYDRYQLVTDPLRYQRTRTKSANARLMLMTWIFTIVYCITYSYLVYLTFEDHEILFTVCDMTFNFIVPLGILLTLNIGVYVKLAKHMNWRSNEGTKRIRIAHSGNGDSSITATKTGECHWRKSDERENDSSIDDRPFRTTDQNIKILNTSSPLSVHCRNPALISEISENTKTEFTITSLPFACTDVKLDVQRSRVHTIKSMNKTIRNSSIFVAVFLLCWLPLRCLFVLRSLTEFGDDEVLRDTSTILLYSNSAINPFIYDAMNRRYRKSLLAIFKHLLCR